MPGDVETRSANRANMGHGCARDVRGSARTSPEVLAVVVDYRKGPRTVLGVQSLLRQYPLESLHVVVLDNSEDPENAQFLRPLADSPGVEIRIQDRNIGYTRACNVGAALRRSEYILLQNPDIIWEQDRALQRLIAYMEANPDVVIAGPGQVNDDGSRPDIARRFPTLLSQIMRRVPLRILRSTPESREGVELPVEQGAAAVVVDWLQSSCIVVRRDFWERIGGLDERYFLFMADPDLARRASEHGLKVVLLQDLLVRADGRRASAGGLGRILITPAGRWHVRDALLYYRKWGLLRATPKLR